MILSQLLSFLEEIAPASLALPGDNVGLLVGDPAQEVTGVLLALDCGPEIVDEAAARGMNVLLTHHPVIFEPLTRLTPGRLAQDNAAALLRRDMAAVCLHTNLDAAAGGVNDCLARRLGLAQVEILPDAEGIGRMGLLPEAMEEADFLRRVCAALEIPALRYVPAGRVVRRVAVGGGSCGEYWLAAQNAGCDALVTSQLKHHTALEIRHAGLLVLDAGHYATEAVVLAPLEARLRAAFPGLPAALSARQADPLSYFVKREVTHGL